MAIIKCKMCGGDLNLIEGASTAECEFCGSVQTVPKVDDEKKLTLFARANRLRAACDFDKAAGIYEAIVADFPEEAEAYWGLVLCKYGIEYVDDPGTGKKIPTCHRSSYDSVIDDGNFEQAMENADIVAQKVYREEAKTIERIRKGILEVSSKEQPYDIFICYKETAPNGDRTLDSVLAQDLYSALTDKGYRVFFSRITLQGKLGEAYEPYIFAALNSAKVMLAVGTCYEYYNAVWVKNEWSRYLKICEADKSKHLIPCYKNLDPEDMPKEFNHLQGADLGKMGAIQDILFNMGKYIPLKKQTTTVIQEKVVVGGSGNSKIVSLLDRGNMALEDGDWAKADSFFEDVLNNDSKNAQAYLGKALVTEKCRTIDAFARKRKDATQNVRSEKKQISPNTAHIWKIVEQYTVAGYVEGQTIRALYDFDLSYLSEAAGRREQYKAEETYWLNHKWLSKAEKFATGTVAEHLQREKKALFAALSDRVKQAETDETAAKKKVEERYAQHITRADAEAEKLYNDGLKRREADYQILLQIAKTSSNVAELTETTKKFAALGDYQESKNLAEHCRKRVTEEQAKLDAEAERQRVLKEKQEKAKKAKNKKIAIISAVTVALVLVTSMLITNVIIPNSKYNNAVALMEAGKYTEAIAAFEALDSYKDSVVQIENCNAGIIDGKYNNAVALMEAGEYTEAIAAFEELDGYKDSAVQIENCNAGIIDGKYNNAVALMEAGKYIEAIAVFEELDGYKDSAVYINNFLDTQYNEALALIDTENYDEAGRILSSLEDYKNAYSMAQYAEALSLLKQGMYEDSSKILSSLGDFQDAKTRLQECYYSWGIVHLKEENFDEAYMLLEKSGNYLDAAELVKESRLTRAEAYEAKGIYDTAAELYRAVPDLKKANYCDGHVAYEHQKFYTARDCFEAAGDYGDAADLAAECVELLQELERVCGTYQWVRGVFNGEPFTKDKYADSSETFKDRIVSYSEERGFYIEVDYGYMVLTDYGGYFEPFILNGKHVIESTFDNIYYYYQFKGDYLEYRQSVDGVDTGDYQLYQKVN